MRSIALKLPEELCDDTTRLAGILHVSRSEYHSNGDPVHESEGAGAIAG